MIFIIPFIIGAIGVAIGAVGGASAAHALREKDKQEAKHYRKAVDEINDKYSKLQKRYYDLGDKSKAEIKDLNIKLAISEVEKDTLHLLVELQQEIIRLIVEIDNEPSFIAIENLKKAILFTNLVLTKFGKPLIVLPDDYILRNLNRSLDEATDDKDRAYYFYVYGQILHDEGKYQDAIWCCNESIELDYSNYLVYLQKGQSLTELGRYQESILTLNIALSLEINDARIWGERALAYSFLGNSTEELKNYQHALCSNPNYYQVCYENGVFFEERGEKTQAIKHYTQALRIKPNFAEAYYRRGILNSGLGDPLFDQHYKDYREKAHEDLKKAQVLFDKQGDQMPKIPVNIDSSLQIIFRDNIRIKYGSQVSIKACNDRYVMSRLNHHGKLAAKAENINEWEKFEIVSAKDSFSDDKYKSVRYGDKIAFRAIGNNKFVCSDLSNHGKLSACASHVKEWETFIVLPSQNSQEIGIEIEYGDSFTLQVHDNKKVKCKVKEHGRMCIDSSSKDVSEVFVFIKPTE